MKIRKINSLLGLNIIIVILNIVVFSPGLIGINIDFIDDFKTAIGITVIIMSIIIFIIGNYKILINSKEEVDIFKLEDDEVAKKYFKQGVELGNRDSEYMLAGLYLKKGRTMYKELADEGLFNSKDIYDSIPEFKLNTDSFLVPKFVEFIETKIEEEEYIPNYILDIQEDLSNKYEKRIDKMLVENRLGYK